MATHKSAIKRHKQSIVRAARNRNCRTRMRNAIKVVRVAITDKNFEEAEIALRAATSILDKTASKGIVHWKTAARKVSRLHNALAKAKAEK